MDPEAARLREAVPKLLCTRCRSTPAKNGFEGFCKSCWPRRTEDAFAPRCFYCATVDATIMPCGWSEACARSICVCAACANMAGKALCDACWMKDWGGSCLRCKGNLPTTQSWSTKYCVRCFRESFCADVSVSLCFFCNAGGDNVHTMPCTYREGCPGHVNVCGRCRHDGKVVCSACHSRDWKSAKRCFTCKLHLQYVGYGKYCRSCYAFATDAGNREFLDAEVAARKVRLSVPIDLLGPAVTNLLITPILHDPLPKYSESAEYISSAHCRLCLADCFGLVPLSEYPVPNVASAELPASLPRGSTDSCGLVSSSVHQVPNVTSAEPPARTRGEISQEQSTGGATGIGSDSIPHATIPIDRYNWGVDFRVARHALECHGFSPGQYCHEVFGRVLAEGLQPITPQIQRSCLFKGSPSTANPWLGKV